MRCQRNNCNGPMRPENDGYICIICGTFHLKPIDIVLNVSGKVAPVKKKTRNYHFRGRVFAIEFYDQIKKQRMNAEPWDDISAQLRKNGYEISSNALRIQWHKEHDRRCNQLTTTRRVAT